MTSSRIAFSPIQRSQQVANHVMTSQTHQTQSIIEKSPYKSDMTDMQPRIQIVGAGIAGLSLACHLRFKRIPFQIYDAASKPKGHNYGITIPSRAYESILAALDPPLTAEDFITTTAVDRMIDGRGMLPSSTQDLQNEKKTRISDSALRDILARNHEIHWNHRVTKATSTDKGLQLEFDDGSASTAPITIDAGGERSGLLSLLLPDLAPTVLPYAVYHGSRYISIEDFTKDYSDLFEDDDTVREYSIPYQPPYPSTQPTMMYIQISKSYITHDQLPTPIRNKYSTSMKFVELRYTISRPALLSSSSTPSTAQLKDPIFNPNRTTQEASQTPPQLFSELDSLITQTDSFTSISSPSSSSSSSSSANPTNITTKTTSQSLLNLLTPSKIQTSNDRLLNWLLRIKTPNLQSSPSPLLSPSTHLLLLGDSSQSLPILGSRGAEYAMIDAAKMAEFLEMELLSTDERKDTDGKDQDQDQKTVKGLGDDWDSEMEEVRRQRLENAMLWLEERHSSSS